MSIRISAVAALVLYCAIAAYSKVIVPCPDGKSCFKVGFTFAETGNLSPEGNSMVKGYILWAEKINANDSYPIKFELIGYDDQSAIGNIISLYTQLVNDDQVDFLLGPYGSSLGKKANAAANITGKFIMQSNAASEDVYTSGYPNVFGVITPTGHYAESAMKLFKQRGVKKIAIAVSDATFSLTVTQGILDFATTNGMTLAGPVRYYNSTDNDEKMTKMLTAIKGYNPDAFFSVSLLRDGEQVLRICNDIGFYPNAFWMTSAPSDPQFVIDMGKEAEGLVGPAQWAPQLSYQGEFFGTGPSYVAQYKARFNNTTPSFTAASATAAGLALTKALEQATNTSDQDSVIEAIKALNFTTFYGPISFSANGENRAKGMVATQIINGVVEIVAPLSVKTADFVYPIRPASTTGSEESAASVAQVSMISLLVLLAALAL